MSALLGPWQRGLGLNRIFVVTLPWVPPPPPRLIKFTLPLRPASLKNSTLEVQTVHNRRSFDFKNLLEKLLRNKR